jgi:vacuole morphology and inheritance protein 14
LSSLSYSSHYHFYRKYLEDPTEDVKIATENILADFLKEIRDVTAVQKRMEETKSRRTTASIRQSARQATNDEVSRLEQGAFIAGGGEDDAEYDKASILKDEPEGIDNSGSKLIKDLTALVLTWRSLGTRTGCQD